MSRMYFYPQRQKSLLRRKTPSISAFLFTVPTNNSNRKVFNALNGKSFTGPEQYLRPCVNIVWMQVIPAPEEQNSGIRIEWDLNL